MTVKAPTGKRLLSRVVGSVITGGLSFHRKTKPRTMTRRHYIRTLLLVTMIATGLVLASACDSESPDDHSGESELITRVTVTLTPEGGGAAVVAVAEDPDGDGANLQIDPINLVSNTTYSGVIGFFDGINNEDITAEVDEESDEHQLWYTPEGGIASRVAVTVTDTDANELPVGLAFTLTVSDGPAATGVLNVVLSHYDEVVKDGTTRSDETDVDVDFPVTITL